MYDVIVIQAYVWAAKRRAGRLRIMSPVDFSTTGRDACRTTLRDINTRSRRSVIVGSNDVYDIVAGADDLSGAGFHKTFARIYPVVEIGSIQRHLTRAGRVANRDGDGGGGR